MSRSRSPICNSDPWALQALDWKTQKLTSAPPGEERGRDEVGGGRLVLVVLLMLVVLVVVVLLVLVVLVVPSRYACLHD